MFSAGGGCEITVTSRHLSYKTHGHVYSSCLGSTMIHASETLPLAKTNLQRLQGYDQTDLQNQAGLPLGGRTPYITSKNRVRTPKLHIKDVPRTSENSLVRPKTDIETSCRQKKTRPHLLDYVICVRPSYWKLKYLVY